jgi:hypothetical protein
VVHFRLKVVSGREHGRIIALSDDVTVTDRAGAREEMSLLPVNFVDLGELVWRLEYGPAVIPFESAVRVVAPPLRRGASSICETPDQRHRNYSRDTAARRMTSFVP